MTERAQPAERGSQAEIENIIRTARALGVEVNETDVAQWLTAMAASDFETDDWSLDEDVGIYGHRVTLLDFDPQTLERYRRIADIVQLPDKPNVETAVSLSGSAAQGRIQRYPGDCDYFERVNIIAETREAACQILGQLMREKALDFFEGPNYQLIEVKFGTWKTDVVKEGKRIKAGTFMSWEPGEVKAGQMEVFRPDGQAWTVEWEYAYLDPGWCKMDWVIAEPEQGRVVNASNMLDVTWETPEGEIIPLDGFLDPYFQEVYLEADSVPVFTKLAQHISPQALEEYVKQLTKEVHKYTDSPANYGKAAKRLYNIFRLIGQHGPAALIRELFDEPAALLYQVWALLDTVDEAAQPDSTIDQEAVTEQVDELIKNVVASFEGEQEVEVVTTLLRLRDDITGRKDLGDEWGAAIRKSRAAVEGSFNAYFKEKLLGIPEVVQFLEVL